MKTEAKKESKGKSVDAVVNSLAEGLYNGGLWVLGAGVAAKVLASVELAEYAISGIGKNYSSYQNGIEIIKSAGEAANYGIWVGVTAFSVGLCSKMVYEALELRKEKHWQGR